GIAQDLGDADKHRRLDERDLAGSRGRADDERDRVHAAIRDDDLVASNRGPVDGLFAGDDRVDQPRTALAWRVFQDAVALWCQRRHRARPARHVLDNVGPVAFWKLADIAQALL